MCLCVCVCVCVCVLVYISGSPELRLKQLFHMSHSPKVISTVCFFKHASIYVGAQGTV